MRWTEISIDAETQAVDAVGHALNTAGCTGFAVRDELIPSQVSGYLPVDDRLEDRLLQLKESLCQLPSFGVSGAGTELTLRYVEEADWANAWKAFFKPIRLGQRLIITPPWEHPEVNTGDIPLIIDPGMAFGTGTHPTTQLCLLALEEYVTPGIKVADIGTGSGILAIAASKLGASQVIATDIDPLAVKIAAENAQVNGVDLNTQEALPEGSYDLVVANILADVIIGLSDQLVALVKPEGLLITSGIIDHREMDVQTELVQKGFTHLETRRQGEWVAIIFRQASRV